MSDHKITVGFNITDEFGNEYRSESTESVFDESDLDFIGRQLNTFLSQCGYYRANPMIFMESITYEECDMLESFLKRYRESGDRADENNN